MFNLNELFGKLGVGANGRNEVAGEEAIRIATCAVLLEMAHIDGEFSEVERDLIVSILKEEHGLSEEEAEALIRTSQQELDESLDLWKFTNTINQHYSVEDKVRIVERVWRVAYSDSQLDRHEDYLLHKLATLLRLHHSELIEAKRRAMVREEGPEVNEVGMGR